MDAGPLSIVPRERGASEGRGGGAPFLDGKRGLLVAVVARVAREALAEAVVAVAEAAARALGDELVLVRGRGRELDDELEADLLAEAYARMPQPCRVVVSGPGEYNSAVREMLMDLVDDLDSVTVLSA